MIGEDGVDAIDRLAVGLVAADEQLHVDPLDDEDVALLFDVTFRFRFE